MTKNSLPASFLERLERPQCGLGKKNLCCRLCLLGPCRITKEGIHSACGASQELIIARNLLRFVAAGAATHCGHALHIARSQDKEIPADYCRRSLPGDLYDAFHQQGLLPAELPNQHFVDISEALHLSTMGVNADYRDVLRWCFKMALIDGCFGLHLATELEDGLWGKPQVKHTTLNLDCIHPDKVNIAVHGHEPLLAMKLVEEARHHEEINLIGVCCTGSTILAQAGIPMAAHFSLQEQVITTGMIEALVVDVHCIMPSVSQLCGCFHTRLISTNELGRFPEATHLPIHNEQDAQRVARQVIEMAIANRKNRTATSSATTEHSELTEPVQQLAVGFSEENIPLDTIARQLQSGEKSGVVGVVGCVNPRSDEDWSRVYEELSRDQIILTTGCMAFELGRRGLLDGRDFFHLGSCVNNARIAKIFERIAHELGRPIGDCPFTVSAPMPVSEKSAAIAFYFAALGCDVHIGDPSFLTANDNVVNFLQDTLAAQMGNRLILSSSGDELIHAVRGKRQQAGLTLSV